jgi:hypothetical protein
MTILPDDLVKRIPPLHTQDSLADNRLTAYARLTLRDAGMTWYILELDTDQDTFSAYLIDPKQEQFGYFSFEYLEEHLGIAALDLLGEIPGEGFILGLSEIPSIIECDESFTTRLLVDAVRQERIKRHIIGEGLPTDASLAPHRAYYYAASFSNDAASKYKAIRDMVLNEDVNLSAYRIPPPALPNWHIVVIGDWPSKAIHNRIINELSEGSLTTIPYDLLIELFARKVEENKKGNWREHHTTIRIKRKTKRQKGKRSPGNR